MEAKLIQYNKRLETQANTDTLTGLYNRRKGMDVLEKTLEKLSVAGDSAEALSVCICDIDFFKKVNDTYGHDFGDEVLKTVSDTLKESVGERNMAIRWGGEEFLLIFKGINGENAYPIVEMIRSKIKNKKLMYEDTEVSVTMTFGLAEYGYSESLTELLKNADEKLYQGKESGRNRVIY